MECPACSHPDRNIPPDWINASDSRRWVCIYSNVTEPHDLQFSNHSRWLYLLNLTIDTNFRLKNKACGIEDDPPLGDGWGHWVPNEPYQRYIKEHGYQKEVRLRFCKSVTR